MRIHTTIARVGFSENQTVEPKLIILLVIIMLPFQTESDKRVCYFSHKSVSYLSPYPSHNLESCWCMMRGY